MRARFCRRVGTALTFAALIAASATLPALAGESSQLDRGSHRHVTSASRNRFIFKSGVLQLDNFGHWVLADGTLLRTDDQTLWIDEAMHNAIGMPIEGRAVRIMGQLESGALLVRHASLLDQVDVAQSLTLAPVSQPDTPAPVRPQ